MPPHSCSVPASRYCFIESSVSCVISFEWSTGKMKFDAWPVEPPGFGNGPLSSWTRSVQPSSASQPVRLLPTMPPPITTQRALLGKSLTLSASHGQEHAVHRLLEVLDVRAHRLSCACAVSGLDRLEERAMRIHRLFELVRPIEGDRPDPEREHVILLECRLEELVVRCAVDSAVDPLVEVHQLAAAGLELVEKRGERGAVGLGRPLRCQAGGLRLEHLAHLREPRELAYVDAGHEHPAARIDLDEPLVGEPAERLADGRPSDLEPLDQLPLVDHGAGRELERHDQEA